MNPKQEQREIKTTVYNNGLPVKITTALADHYQPIRYHQDTQPLPEPNPIQPVAASSIIQTTKSAIKEIKRLSDPLNKIDEQKIVLLSDMIINHLIDNFDTIVCKESAYYQSAIVKNIQSILNMKLQNSDNNSTVNNNFLVLLHKVEESSKKCIDAQVPNTIN